MFKKLDFTLDIDFDRIKNEELKIGSGVLYRCGNPNETTDDFGWPCDPPSPGGGYGE